MNALTDRVAERVATRTSRRGFLGWAGQFAAALVAGLATPLAARAQRLIQRCDAEILVLSSEITGDATIKVGETKTYTASVTYVCGQCRVGRDVRDCDAKLTYQWSQKPIRDPIPGPADTGGIVKFSAHTGQTVQVTGDRKGKVELWVQVHLTCGEKECTSTDFETLKKTITVVEA